MTGGSPISGSVEQRADGSFLVRVEVEGVLRTFHFHMRQPEEGTETMLKDEYPDIFREWLAAAGGLDKVLDTLFSPYAVATHHKIASGIAESEAIRARLPLP